MSDLMNELMSDKGVCRTAPATTSLLNNVPTVSLTIVDIQSGLCSLCTCSNIYNMNNIMIMYFH